MSKDFLDLKESYFPMRLSPKSVRDIKVRIAEGEVEFDTIVGTGLSGTLHVPQLARSLRKKFCIVRKPSEFRAGDGKTHGDRMVVGELGRRWLFVDDGISSGATLRRVNNAITDAAKGIRAEHQRFNPVSHDGRWDTTLVGAITYGWSSADYVIFHSADKLFDWWLKDVRFD